MTAYAKFKYLNKKKFVKLHKEAYNLKFFENIPKTIFENQNISQNDSIKRSKKQNSRVTIHSQSTDRNLVEQLKKISLLQNNELLIEEKLKFNVDDMSNMEIFDNQDLHKKVNRHQNILITEDSFFYLIWSCIMASFLILNMILIPYEISNDPIVMGTTWQTFFNIIIEGLFITDIFLNFFTAQENRQKVEIVSLKEIANNYLKNWFLVDVVSSFPTTNFEQFGIIPTSAINNGWLKILKLPKQVRIIRYVSQQLFSKMLFILSELTENIIDYALVVRINKLAYAMIIFFFIGNVMACWYISFVEPCQNEQCPINWFFYIISDEYDIAIVNVEHSLHNYALKIQELPPTERDTLIYSQVIENSDQRWILQVKAWQYVFQTVTTVGQGDVKSVGLYDNAFRIICMLIGVVLFSFMSSTLMDIMLEDNQATDPTLRRAQVESLIIKYRLKNHSRKFLYQLTEGIYTYHLKNEYEFLQLLPDYMRNKVLDSIFHVQQMKFPIFENINLELFFEFQKRAAQRKCISDEDVRAEFNELQQVWSGKVGQKVLNLNPVIQSQFQSIFCSGSDMGQDCLLEDNSRDYYSLKCITEVELILIPLDNLLEITEKSGMFFTHQVMQKFQIQIYEIQAIVCVQYILFKMGCQIESIWYNRIINAMNFTEQDYKILTNNQIKQLKRTDVNQNSEFWYQGILDIETMNQIHKNINKLSQLLIKDEYKYLVDIMININASNFKGVTQKNSINKI